MSNIQLVIEAQAAFDLSTLPLSLQERIAAAMGSFTPNPFAHPVNGREIYLVWCHVTLEQVQAFIAGAGLDWKILVARDGDEVLLPGDKARLLTYMNDTSIDIDGVITRETATEVTIPWLDGSPAPEGLIV